MVAKNIFPTKMGMQKNSYCNPDSDVSSIDNDSNSCGRNKEGGDIL